MWNIWKKQRCDIIMHVTEFHLKAEFLDTVFFERSNVSMRNTRKWFEKVETGVHYCQYYIIWVFPEMVMTFVERLKGSIVLHCQLYRKITKIECLKTHIVMFPNITHKQVASMCWQNSISIKWQNKVSVLASELRHMQMYLNYKWVALFISNMNQINSQHVVPAKFSCS